MGKYGKEEQCSEATLLFHLMSGLHTSINMHVADAFENDKGELEANTTYFLEKIGKHPERIKNLYLIYAALLRAVS